MAKKLGSSTSSPSRRSASARQTRSSRSAAKSSTDASNEVADGEDEVDDDHLFNSQPAWKAKDTRRALPSHPRSAPVSSPHRRPEKRKEERKASVRKETYDLDDSESELSDAPDEEEDQDDGSDDFDDTESDSDMAARLMAAGDGESLLGSAASDGGETDEEEERFIIQDANRRQAKIFARRQGSHAPAELNETHDQEENARSDGSGSLSPHTLRQLGLVDLFDDEDFGSCSEPSFTDFFGSDSGHESDAGDDVQLRTQPDDDQLTTDDEDSEADISDLDQEMLSAPFMNVGRIAAGAGTQMGADSESGPPTNVPLLVIEDLDGRLIYARAGDGEAVFGSDGEFEFVDDSDSDESDLDLGTSAWGHDGNLRLRPPADDETDDGDTTDELPNEDMPFPRLLVGSVAPHGGRNARRARAIAARARRASPNSRSRESSANRETGEIVQVCGKGAGEQGIKNIDFSISTEALARDPQGTLENAAQSLGISVDDVAKLVAGIDGEVTSMPTPPSQQLGLPPVTPEQSSASKPQMGSFMPTSSKSVHRAVIDGSRQAPSPFTARHGTQKRGLAHRRRHTGESTPSMKRARKMSLSDSNQQPLSAAEGASESGASTSTRNHSPFAEEEVMDLDDVMDASLLWRGSISSSPPRDDDTPKKTSPVLRASKRASGTPASPNLAGFNYNAVARWNRIPMGAFRDGQGSASQTHPLGTYLLTRSRGQREKGHSQRGWTEHSPFRGRSQGDTIHLGPIPAATRDSFMVSPVLWPVRPVHGSNYAQTSSGQVARIEPPNGSDHRKMTTRREKREKRARRAAMRAVPTDQANSAATSGAPSPSGESPSSALPRLSITDPSPRGSPTPAQKRQASAPIDIVRSTSPTYASVAQSSPQQASSLSTSPSSQQQPPSSVFGMPLHSPLFSGLLHPPNLGFRDDLEERDEEGVLTI